MNIAAFGLLFGILFSAPFTSCQKGEKSQPVLGEANMMNVSYGNDSSQIMDIYLPGGRDTANTKVLLFIHGGSWSRGDKDELTAAINAIRTMLSDYAIFNMNYRLARNDSTRFPAQVNDVERAMSFIEGKAHEYKINANKFGLVGASAGAHLALLQAYKNNRNGTIKAVVDLFGPADLKDLYSHHPLPDEARPVLVNFLGATPTTKPDVYFQASPLNFVDAHSVPTKIFHGAGDIVVPITQSNALAAKLKANNVKVDLTVYENEGHGWYGNNLLDTYQKTTDFIKENVH